ncbi:caspase recruitment domain-containing protein 9 isoform X2 [Bos indicus x Bos taurus]|uniref:caspase recruitment domain-containing protein 9 isoform X2 n=1 Tax=Bos indicus x Bos taurus TaxID=30522 RepID=UPI000F7D0A06|nr:caspase recruitment domain-containing protein 9 isoform X2 [Bos indicus x Bos taurus]
MQAMSDYENEDACWSALEGFRVKLISAIDPARVTPYLRQCNVLSPDDEEQVLSDPSLVTRKRKVGVLLDILQRTGHKGYVAFLESLELYYPQLYRKVTGKEPTRVFSVIIDASGESGLTQLLMSEVMKLQRKVQELTALLGSRDDLAEELRVKDSLLRKLQERVQRLKEACEAGSRELQRCKDENYDLALRLARQSEERDAALTGHRGLLLEIDRLKHSLMRAEDDCRVERKHTLKLRHAMELRPSQELLWELQQEKALLQARVQGLEASVQEGKADPGRPHVQVPEEDWQRVQRDLQQQAATIFSLRKDLRQAEALRTRSAEEKETLELQCLALRRDSKMYKDRIEAILQQMEEVAIERDQATLMREELHAQHARSLQDKDALRKQVRELSEKVDELQLQLFQREGQLLAVEGKLRRRQLDALILSSDLEDSSPRNSQEFLPPQDLEDTQLSDKGEDTRHLSRRNLTKASSWWQVGSCLDLQHTRCMMLVPGDARPSPGPMTFMPHFKDGHIGAQKDEQPPESGQDPPLSLGPRLGQLPLGPGMLRGGAPALWSRERGSGHCPGAASQEVGTDREGGTAPGDRSGGFRRQRRDHSACLDTGCGVAPGG